MELGSGSWGRERRIVALLARIHYFCLWVSGFGPATFWVWDVRKTCFADARAKFFVDFGAPEAAENGLAVRFGRSFRFLLVFLFAFPSAVIARSIFVHRHSEQTRLRIKTRVPEPFWAYGRSFLCTGAVGAQT